MQYRNGSITVPNDGLYYVYGQMYYRHSSSSYLNAGFRMRVNGVDRAFAYRVTNDANGLHTHYLGRIIHLNKGDELSLTFEYNSYYRFSNERALFGAFLVN